MTEFTPIDLRNRAFPETVTKTNYEELLVAYKRDLIALYPEAIEIVNSETDPLIIILQVLASEVTRIRDLINDEARKNTLAHGFGSSLDNFGDFWGLARHVIEDADPSAYPPKPAVMEDDETLRARIQIAPEGLTTAGSPGSYIYHALNASADVKAARPWRSAPGETTVAILSREANGQAPETLTDHVRDYLLPRTPLCADLVVQSAQIHEYIVAGVITFLPGYATQDLLVRCELALEAHCTRMHGLGIDITRAGLTHALYLEGVQNVVLTSPAADIICNNGEAAFRIDSDLSDGGVNV